ncbi:acyl carrier protein [Nocardia wallacei]|uniref:acyl carrier protein n=1 Tax=Nocardia wallacei TaxID=480035 RepID=UPI0024566D39|nr:acyl carrier protein [Nocardia wallacei]
MTTYADEIEYREVVECLTRWCGEVFAASVHELDDNTVIMDIEGADSVRMLRLLGLVEQHFDVQLMTDELPMARTVGQLAEQVVHVRCR